jgi:protease stability complex PrcB-like protein
MAKTAVIISAAVVAAACSNPTAPGSPAAVVIQRFGPSGRSLAAFSGYDQPERFVIRDSATMAMVWETIYRGVSPRPDMPLVDFTRNMVLVVALGARPTSGYNIVLDSATLAADGLTVYTQISSPAGGASLPFVTQPLDAGVVPRTTGPVRFVDRF